MIELLLQAERELSAGRLDRAEITYRQVAEADPRNSIAVVGLARVALERGDEADALELGRRALTIDPENAAAHRLVRRLEEVRAYRGPAAIEPGPAADEATVATEPAATEPAATEPEPEPAMAEVPKASTKVTEPAPAAEPAPPTQPAPPRRRSWLDRLFRRNR